MKEIKITDSKIKEALEQIDAITELNIKERGCLRLLTEEMFSMCHELLNTYTLDFEIKQDGKRYALSGTTKTWIDETTRTQLLSASSSGKNAANKGLKGIIGAILDTFLIEGNPVVCSPALSYGMYGPNSSFGCMWSLSRYIEVLREKADQPQWDGLEKSLIANFADDVSIGVRSGKLQMTVTKTF